MRRGFVISGSRSSAWQNKTSHSSDAIALDFPAAWISGKVVVHSVAVDVSSSRVKDRLTLRQQKSVSFEELLPSTPRRQSEPRKLVAGA